MNKRIGQDAAIREQRPKSKRTIQREDQNLLYFTLKTFITSETLFTLFTLFSSVFFSEVKIGGIFCEETRNDSKIQWKIVANEASLKRYVANGEASAFPFCFRIYQQGTFRRSSERACYRACCAKRARKWKHWHGGNEKMIVISWRMAEDIARDNELNERS